MELEAIPGIGKKTADSLASLENAEEALRDGDVATLASAPGVSTARAARIARAAIRHRHDDVDEFLLTDRARAIHQVALDLLTDRAVTDYGARRLETLYPSARQSRIDEVRALTERALAQEPDSAVIDALGGVAPLREPTDVVVRDRCLATADGERYAKAREAVPELSVEHVDDARELAELGRAYSSVIALDETFAGLDLEGDITVDPHALDNPVDVVPERSLSFFAANRERILAAIAVHREAKTDTEADLNALEQVLDRIDDDGSVADDDEVNRLDAAVDALDSAVSEAERLANDRLRAAIRQRDVTIEGTDLLSLVEQGAGVDSLLERELADDYSAALSVAREELVGALDLDEDEATVAEGVLPADPTYPVERDPAAVQSLRESLTRKRDRRATRLKREVARELADRRPVVERLVADALDLDVELAIARFADDFDCSIPRFVEEDVTIEGGRSPMLDIDFDAVEPVDYHLDGVRLLSGVNSGGKTSLLDLLALIVVLAQMGLPVPAATAELKRFDGLYYHAKTQGTLDAGAFEHTLREFAGLADDGRDGLVLVDELESITEPGASALIIAGVLEALQNRGATGVFVSHLAGEIRAAAEVDVPVDGIEALGLEDGELNVDRTPKPNHLARSTPQLIVEKLAEADDREFYRRLLEKFD